MDLKNWLIHLRAGRLLLVATLLSVLLTELVVSVISQLIYGAIRTDYLVTAFIASTLVSVVVVTSLQAVVRALQRSDEQLLERTLYLDSILQSSAQTLIVALDTEFHVRYLNALAERILNTRADEAQGKPITALVGEAQRGQLERALRILLSERNHSFQFSHQLNGDLHYFEGRLNDIVHRDRLAGYLLIAHDISDRKKLEETLRDLSFQDGLTGIANRRRFDSVLAQEWRRAAREHQPISLIMLDIDFFKNYNDLYGHPAGDECLKKIARVLDVTTARPGDTDARYGGEEFAAILPNTARDGAEQLAEEIRAHVEALHLPHANSAAGPWVTVSAGVATYTPNNGEDHTLLLRRADGALYRAKHQGRNRVVVDHH